MTFNYKIQRLAEDAGIVFPDAIDFMDSQVAMDARLALDAAPPNALQSQLITVGSSGVPAYLANYIDPVLTRVLVAPTKFAEIFGEAKKGDWTTLTATFPLIESSGEVSSYGDFNNNGMTSANMNWEPRQSYHYQAFTQWGDMELARAGLAKVNWANEQNMACALNFKKFQNKSYAFGIDGLDNFGWLNDPSLPTPITPFTKTSNSSTQWVSSTGVPATGVEIFADIQALFKQLVAQTGGNVDLESGMTLILSSLRQSALVTPMSLVYGTATVKDMIKETFPNMKVATAVEYSTASGELMQLKADQLEGQEIGACCFTEKMRAHALVRETSSTHQKKSAGTWGAIIKVPAGIAQMLGI